MTGDELEPTAWFVEQSIFSDNDEVISDDLIDRWEEQIGRLRKEPLVASSDVVDRLRRLRDKYIDHDCSVYDEIDASCFSPQDPSGYELWNCECGWEISQGNVQIAQDIDEVIDELQGDTE